jgi:acetolactate synthase I/II/III large subunit
MKYSDLLIDWLKEFGYTHCFFVGGGNVMHLLESARTRLTCIPVVHEVAAAIAAEYFNESHGVSGPKAFAMVTAGPGVTNLVTGVAGAWLESRELLVIAGQARTDALSRGTVRQIGHQEIDGTGIMRPITKISLTIEKTISKEELRQLVLLSSVDRKGPVFLEFCLDVTAAKMDEAIEDSSKDSNANHGESYSPSNSDYIAQISALLSSSKRPILLFGGGLSREFCRNNLEKINRLGVPVATTWNGSDRYPGDGLLYAGRPNTYGMRSANIIIQQADLVIALGTRLGLQQTGFNWESFVPVGKLVQVDIDQNELVKESPRKDLSICADANEVLASILSSNPRSDLTDWQEFIRNIRLKIPRKDPANKARFQFIEAFDFVISLNEISKPEDQIIPCSSGGAFTTMMQAFELKGQQIMITNKGLASMGYGLSGAIGAAIAHPGKRTILTEGDGGFAQNLQELGLARLRSLNLKIFIFSNQGYASIRTMQKAYFAGNYIGCDESSGVALPEWPSIFNAFGIPCRTMNTRLFEDPEIRKLFEYQGPAAFIVPLDPEQMYFPKVTSRVMENGKMSSNPIHLMAPDLSETLKEEVFSFLPKNLWN